MRGNGCPHASPRPMPMTWRQVSNKDGSVVDEWVLHQDKHGPFN